MKKKILSLVLVGVMAFSMTACGLSKSEEPAAEAPKTEAPASDEAKDEAPAAEEPAAETITLVMAEVNPLDTIVGQMDSEFKNQVEKLSNGTIKIDLQASGVLGDETAVLDTMLGGGGTIDISRISAFALTSYGGEKSKLLSIPYTWKNREHFWNFATSDLAKEFLAEPSENGSGVRGLFYGEEGFRHFFSKQPLDSIDSLKGMKIRVSNDPVMVGMVKGLGADATEVAFNELYSSLQTGVVDAAEQPIANYKSNAFPEVAPNMILDGHTLGAVQVIITDEAWNKLSAEQQDILTQAGEAASKFCREKSESMENEVLEALKAEGCTITEVTDNTPWAEACKDVISESTKGYEDLYQQLLDFAN